MKDPTVQTWKAFLPRRAIVMARYREEHTEAPIIQSVPEGNENNSLDTIHLELNQCQRCKLCEKRKTIVFGEGNPKAELMFIGEGPGEQEDLQGRPFVGKAGQLLDRMIEAMGLKRGDVYIANVVKCRPPGNRNPEGDEIAACSPFLLRQVDTIRPKVIVALGKFAAQTLLNTEVKITQLRGHFHSYRGAQLMPTFHPAYLLRNPDAKREAWSDLQQVARALQLEVPKGNSKNKSPSPQNQASQN